MLGDVTGRLVYNEQTKLYAVVLSNTNKLINPGLESGTEVTVWDYTVQHWCMDVIVLEDGEWKLKHSTMDIKYIVVDCSDMQI